MIHFKELRSGKDLAFLTRRMIFFNEISGGHSAKHLFDDRVLTGHYFKIYDFDIKLEVFLYFFVFVLLFRKLLKFWTLIL